MFWGLVIGLGVGLLRFALEFVYPPPPCGSPDPDERPVFLISFIDDFHYLHFGALLFLLTGLIAVLTSLLSKDDDHEVQEEMTVWGAADDNHNLLYEPMESKVLVNIFAVVVMTIASFIIGFYA